jgi:uncharacterized protein (DUF486 family)
LTNGPAFRTIAGLERAAQPRRSPSTEAIVSTGPWTPAFVQAAGLLLVSNVFMTFAWYGHLKTLGHKPWYVAAVLSWGIAFVEYMFMVPANRIGSTALTLPQLKILQEVITLAVFAPFAILYMGQPLKLDYLWAGCCMIGAVYFVFR